MTITEALAELKTLKSRITKRSQGIIPYLVRHGQVLDPMAKDGGTTEWVARERQAIRDMEARLVAIRTAIQKRNLESTIKVEGDEKSVAAWLVWRRDAAPLRQSFIDAAIRQIEGSRDMARKNALQILENKNVHVRPEDLVVNIDEASLLAERDHLENVLGKLDGMLSLANATLEIDLG